MYMASLKVQQRELNNSAVCFRSERLNQLSQPKTVLWQQCQREKEGKSMSELMECSFKPQTGRGPDQLLHRRNLPVEDRLFHAYDDRKIVRCARMS